MPQPHSMRLTSVALYALLLLLAPLVAVAQSDPTSSCLYLAEAFDICWRGRQRLPYTDPIVAGCLCFVGGVPDPRIDPAVTACSSFLDSQGRPAEASELYSSYNGYCASYGGQTSGRSRSTDAVTTMTTAFDFGMSNCEAILQVYSACQQEPEDFITQPEVASCICHGPQGEFTTAFDDFIQPCYNWASDSEPEFASEVSLLSGFCTRFGDVTIQTTSTSFNFRPTSRPPPPSLSFSQIDDPASTACERVARIANACRTGPTDPLTRPGVANCICLDPNNPSGGFGTVFDDFLASCVPYAKTRSPAAAREIESLTGYCTRFADGGKTFTVTSTELNATRTVTDDVFVPSSTIPTETNPAPTGNSASRNMASSMVSLGLPSLAIIIIASFL